MKDHQRALVVLGEVVCGGELSLVWLWCFGRYKSSW